MKRIFVPLLFAVILVFSSCSRMPLPGFSETENETAEKERASIQTLACLKEKNPVAQVAFSGKDKAYVQCVYSEESIGESLPSDLYFIDLKKDKILAEKRFPNGFLSLIGTRPNGDAVMYDYEKDEVKTYHEDLSDSVSVFCESFDSPLFFDPVRDSICTSNLENDETILMRTGFDGRKEEIDRFPGLLFLDDFDPYRELFLFTAPDSNDDTGRAFHVYSIKSRSIVFSGVDDYSEYSFSSSGLLAHHTHLIPGEEEESRYSSTTALFDLDTAKEGTAYEFDSVYFESHPKSAYSFGVDYHDGEMVDGELKAEAILADFSSGSYAVFPTGEKTLLAAHLFFSDFQDSALISLSASDGQTEVFWIDPEKIVLDQQFETSKFSLYEKKALHTLGDFLLPARKKADEIEKELSVRILLGDECFNGFATGGYSIVSLEEGPSGDGFSEALRQTETGLDTLHRSLSAYPAGFFEKFTNSLSGGGVWIMIVRDLICEDYENFEAAAIEYYDGVWYNIVIDLDEMDPSTLHHELWHAAEDRIAEKHGMPISPEKWAEFNPEGFQYHTDMDTYLDSDGYQYVLWNSTDPYFASIYSTVNEKEDRATLVQEIFNESGFQDAPDAALYSNQLEWLLSKPHLKAKIDFIAALAKDVFGSVYWEEML